jgi:hypothetical protein
MKLIQPFLLVIVTCMALIYFGRLRSRLSDRMAMITLLGTAVLLICAPRVATNLANFCGVGRGVDLILYLGSAGLAFVSLLMYSKLRALEEKLTEFVRRMALSSAEDSVRPTATISVSGDLSQPSRQSHAA